MKKTIRDVDIFEKIQNEVNSVLELHKSASDDWYRTRFSAEENFENDEMKTQSSCLEEPIKVFA